MEGKATLKVGQQPFCMKYNKVADRQITAKKAVTEMWGTYRLDAEDQYSKFELFAPTAVWSHHY